LWWEYTGNQSAPWTGTGTATSPLPAGGGTGTGTGGTTPPSNVTTIGAADTTDTFMSFIGGSTPASFVVYNDTKADTAPQVTGPVDYEVGSQATGTLNITDFNMGVDSLSVAKGLTLTGESFTTSGAVTFDFSNGAKVVAALAHS
jgi:hypothetical protein